MQNAEIRLLWEVFTEKFKEHFISNEEIWKQQLEQVEEYIIANNKRPSAADKEPKIKSMGYWISDQQKNYKNKKEIMQNAKIRLLWEKFVAKFKEHFISNEEIWKQQLEQVKKYIIANNKRPASTDKDPKIKSMGSWIQHQQKNYKNKTEIMQNAEIRFLWEAITEKFQEHFISNEESWKQQLKQVEDYIIANNKRPSNADKDPKIKSLASWIQHQQKNYKNKTEIMKNVEMRLLWEAITEKFQEHFLSNEEIWKQNLEQNKEYIIANNKRPSKHDKDPKIKSLGFWIGTQLQNYKKNQHIMQNIEIRHLWENFIAKYPQHFPQEKEETPTPTTKPKKSMKLFLSKPTLKTQEPQETSEQKRTRTKSAISVLHQKYITLTPQHMGEQFKENPSLWYNYHDVLKENEANFEEKDIPRNRIRNELDKIQTKRTHVVADMGCGHAYISKYFQNKGDHRFRFLNYDHVSSDPSIISCDISALPLEDHSVEICIQSLAMWGPRTACAKYVAEAYRVLETDGKLYIVEATKRWTTESSLDGGNELEDLLLSTGFTIVWKEINKFSFFVARK